MVRTIKDEAPRGLPQSVRVASPECAGLRRRSAWFERDEINHAR